MAQTELAARANVSLNTIVDFEIYGKMPTAIVKPPLSRHSRTRASNSPSDDKVAPRRFAKGDKVQFKQFEPHIERRLKFKVIHDGEVGMIMVVESPSLSSTLGDYRVSVRFNATIATGISASHFQLVEAVRHK
jgi:hypothetical protein